MQQFLAKGTKLTKRDEYQITYLITMHLSVNCKDHASIFSCSARIIGSKIRLVTMVDYAMAKRDYLTTKKDA